MSYKRIQKEYDDMIKYPAHHCLAAPIDGDLYHWTATIFGGENSPYESGVF